MRIRRLATEAQNCRQQAADLAGMPEAPFLLRLALAFEELASKEVRSHRGPQECQDRLEHRGDNSAHGADPHDELKHFFVCKSCGQAVDGRNLEDISYHEAPGHGPLPSDA